MRAEITCEIKVRPARWDSWADWLVNLFGGRWEAALFADGTIVSRTHVFSTTRAGAIRKAERMAEKARLPNEWVPVKRWDSA